MYAETWRREEKGRGGSESGRASYSVDMF